MNITKLHLRYLSFSVFLYSYPSTLKWTSPSFTLGICLFLYFYIFVLFSKCAEMNITQLHLSSSVKTPYMGPSYQYWDHRITTIVIAIIVSIIITKSCYAMLPQKPCSSSCYSGLTSWRTRSSGRSWRSTPSPDSSMTPSMRCSTNTKNLKLENSSNIHTLIWCLIEDTFNERLNKY